MLPSQTKLVCGLLLLAPLASCITGSLGRTKRFEVVPPGSSDSWVSGETTLKQCLDQLGAPIDVRPAPDGEILMAWYGSDDSGWSATLSVPTGQALDMSASYSDIQDGEQGVVLFFDAQLLLIHWVEGEIANLVREKVRPVFSD